MKNEFDYLNVGGTKVYASDVESRKRIGAIEGMINAYSEYQLEQTSSPSFSRSNPQVAELYGNAMGGYLFYNNNGTMFAAKMNPSWSGYDDGTPFSVDARGKTETLIHVPTCHFKAEGSHMKFGGLSAIEGGKTFASPHWVGAYQMDNNGHSRPGVGSGHSKTMTAFWELAQAIHSDMGLANYQFHCLINALYQAGFGNLNSEYILSNGNSRDSSGWDSYRDLAHGMADSIGHGSGCVQATDGGGYTRYVTKLYGFEDLFGKLWEFRPGIRFYMDGDVRHAVVYDGNIVSNSAEGRDISGVLASAGGNYISAMELGEYWDMLPKALDGGSDIYYCDGAWASTGGELLFVGGCAGHGSHCGLSYTRSAYGFSSATDDIGARLAFYGEPVIVSGAELEAMMA